MNVSGAYKSRSMKSMLGDHVLRNGLSRLSYDQTSNIKTLPGPSVGHADKTLSLRHNKAKSVFSIMNKLVTGMTLAEAAFNKLTDHFKTHCFISNVGEQLARGGGVLSVQNKLINDLSSGGVKPAMQESLGKEEIKNLVSKSEVLVVLDDVSEVNQLETLGVVRNFFYEGSRIVATSRKIQVLEKFSCSDDELHEADKLSIPESLELFSIYALGRREPTEVFMDLSKDIVSLTDGLPLALEVFGSSLTKKEKCVWEDSLSKLREIQPYKLHGLLKLSYDALDVQEKTVFLDISCLLLQMKMTRGDVVDLLKGCGLPAESAIGNLVAKSLMKVLEGNHLWMHDQIKGVGKQIVIEESNKYPGKRSRLWDSGDIRDVLRDGEVFI